MKIAVFYENKIEETEHIAQFLVYQVGINGNEVKLFKIGESNPSDTLNFNSEVILIVTPSHDCKWPCYFGKTATYVKKLGKLIKKGAYSAIKKIGVFNCNEPVNYGCKIKDKIRKAFPNVKTYFFPSLQTNYYQIFKDDL